MDDVTTLYPTIKINVLFIRDGLLKYDGNHNGNVQYDKIQISL